MSKEIQAVQEMQVATEASYGTAVTFPGSDFSTLAFVEGSAEMVLNTEMLDPRTAQTLTDGASTRVIGENSCTLSFSTIAAATGTLAGDNEAATIPNAGKLYKAALGGENIASGDFITSVQSTSKFGLRANDAGGRNLTPGAGINVNGYFATIVNITSTGNDFAFMRMALGASPSAGERVRPAVTYYLSNTESTLQFVVQGAEGSDRWRLSGMYLESMEFEFELGQLPKINWKWAGARWSNLGNGTMQLTAASNFLAVMNVGEFQIQNAGTTTRNEVDIQAFEMSPKINYLRVRSANNAFAGSATIGVVRGRTGPALEGSFTLPFEDTTYYTLRDNKTIQAMHHVVGQGSDTDAARMFAIDIPYAQIVDVQRVDQDGIASQKVSWIAKNDETSADIGIGITELCKSAFRIHVIG